MKSGLLLKEELIHEIRGRLESGQWVLANLDVATAVHVEHEIYPPNTKANEGFILIMAFDKTRKLWPIFLLRKCPGLNKLLRVDGEEQERRLLYVEMEQIAEDGESAVSGAQVIEARPGEQGVAIDRIIVALQGGLA